MKKTVRLLCLLLALVMLFAACGGEKQKTQSSGLGYVKDENVNDPGVFPVLKKPITISIGIPKNTLVQDYDTNLYTQALKEKMNCDIEFVYLPTTTDEAKQKVELMISAGGKDLPDVIINVPLSDSTITRYASKGFIYPLNEYYDKSSYYIKEVLEKEKDLKKYITMTDGNIYVIPSYQKIMQNEFGYRMWIYEPWLEKLGLETPKTLDEFYNVLKAFKEKDPNGNGIADEIPLLGSTNGGSSWFKDFILAAYQPIDIQSSYLYPKKGKIKAAYMEDEYKEGLKYLNKLCKDGLLSASSFTTDAQQTNQTIQNPNGVQVGCFTSMAPTFLNSSDDRKNGYKILPPLTQNDGTGYAMYSTSIPVNSFFITKNCKNPEAAFRLGDIMMSEEMTIWSRFGKKGVDWLEATEDQKGMFDYMGYKAKINPVLAWGTPQNSHWQNSTPGYRSYEISFSTVNSSSNVFEQEIANKLQSYIDKKPKEYITKLIYTDEEMEIVNEVQQNVTSYLSDTVTRFIIGDLDIDKEWDNYINELKAMDVDRMLEIAQKAYDRVNKN